MKIRYFFLVFFSYASAQNEKNWTMLVFMARDNDLSSYAPQHIEQMMAINHDEVNLLVFDCHSSLGKKVAQKIIVTPGCATVLETLPGHDGGDPASFEYACRWALQEYPSKRFGIMVWSHGSGMLPGSPYVHANYRTRGFCYDDATGHCLDDVKIMQAFEKIMPLRKGKKIDLFMFYACFMADIEIMAALAPYVSYAVASQSGMPAKGFPYAQSFGLFKKPYASMENVLVTIVRAYRDYYRSYSSLGTTLTGVDLTVFDNLLGAINRLSEVLIHELNSTNSSTIKRVIAKSVNSVFLKPTYMDFCLFCRQLEQEVAPGIFAQPEVVKNALRDCINATQSCILAQVGTKGSTGLSLYFPKQRVEKAYYDLYFSRISSWTSFIGHYLSN